MFEWIGENSASRKFIKKNDEDQIKHAINIIDKHLFPHMNTDLKGKALFLGHMTKNCFLEKWVRLFQMIKIIWVIIELLLQSIIG